MKHKLRILLVSDRIPADFDGGGRVYPNALLRYLCNKGASITCCCLRDEDKTELNNHQGVKSHFTAEWGNVRFCESRPLIAKRLPLSQRVWRRAIRLWSRFVAPRSDDQSINCYRWSPSPVQIHSIQEMISEERPDWLMINFTQRAPLLDHLTLGSGLRTALIVHDLIANRLEAYRNNGIEADFEELSPAEETSLWAKADLAICIQSNEAASIGASVPELKVIAAPMPLIDRRRIKTRAGTDFVFIGGKSKANVEGAAWLIRTVWPHLRDRLPAAKLHIFGSVCEKMEFADDGVLFHGKVDDVAEAYRMADVALVSLLFGTGLKIKLMEAVSYGVPVVSTSVGAEGIAQAARDSLLIADAPQQFAEACCSLILDPSLATTTAANQWKNFADHYGEEAALGPMLAELSKEPPPYTP